MLNAYFQNSREAVPYLRPECKEFPLLVIGTPIIHQPEDVRLPRLFGLVLGHADSGRVEIVAKAQQLEPTHNWRIYHNPTVGWVDPRELLLADPTSISLVLGKAWPRPTMYHSTRYSNTKGPAMALVQPCVGCKGTGKIPDRRELGNTPVPEFQGSMLDTTVIAEQRAFRRGYEKARELTTTCGEADCPLCGGVGYDVNSVPENRRLPNGEYGDPR